MYAGRDHFNAFEFFARRPGHHVDAEFHAGRNVEEKRRRSVREQFHGPLLVHGRRLRAQRARHLSRNFLRRLSTAGHQRFSTSLPDYKYSKSKFLRLPRTVAFRKHRTRIENNDVPPPLITRYHSNKRIAGNDDFRQKLRTTLRITF